MAEISKVQLEFNKRFFQALQDLIALGKIETIKDFAHAAGVVYNRYTEMDRDFRQGGERSRYRTVEMEMIHELVVNYDINADWLITGRGKMFNKVKQ